MQDIAGEAQRVGVETGYHDALGRWRQPSPEALQQIVAALSAVPPAPPPVVIKGERALDDSPRDDRLVVPAPERAHQPEALRQHGVWMLAVQLYGVRSTRNWGIGDFTDLSTLLELSAEVGAAGIALNPLHAVLDGQPSPYSPSSRLFLNWIYLDVERVPGYARRDADPDGSERGRLRATDLVDYAGVFALKDKALRAAHRRFRTGKRRNDPDFLAFKQQRGAVLASYCAFQTLRNHLNKPWWEWPENMRRPSEVLVASLLTTAPDEMDFHAYVQWQADRQLSACQARARDLGLPIGLYLDVAVGVIPDGADAWSEQDAVMRGLAVGAPPDLLNTDGQNWGLASFHPAALVRSNFALFRATLAASMRYAGAIRLDHVLGLNRVYVVPDGYPASGGTYMRFPFQAMVAVIAAESVANQCLVIGEDLGTVPDGFRDIMADWGIWSYRLALFERGPDGSYHPAERYPEGALVAFSTHDLPTYAGWQAGHDLLVKRALGLDPGEDEGAREWARQRLVQVIAEHRIGEGGTPSFTDIARFLARTPSRLLIVAAEDVFGVIDQPNVPGTIDEHPNWRRKLPLDLDLLGEDRRLHDIGDALANEGRAVRIAVGP
jgi:4-alpha-glucanotransferase